MDNILLKSIKLITNRLHLALALHIFSDSSSVRLKLSHAICFRKKVEEVSTKKLILKKALRLQ